MSDFQHAILGRTGLPVFRLGLSASYRPGIRTVLAAADAGVNLFFAYGFDSQMVKGLRELFRADRDRHVLVTGAYNLLWGHPDLKRTLEKRLRQFRTDHVDVFLFLGVTKPEHFTDRTRDELLRLREDGRVRAVGVSIHHRALAGQLAVAGDLDVLMVRYNAAHRGAERDIFPHLAAHDPGVISYTATRWTRLLRRPRRWDRERLVPPASLAYRFVLSSPHVDVCLTAPRSERELRQNLSALAEGPLAPDEVATMREFGDAVHAAAGWFM